jgi:hypothetical protein
MMMFQVSILLRYIDDADISKKDRSARGLDISFLSERLARAFWD